MMMGMLVLGSSIRPRTRISTSKDIFLRPEVRWYYKAGGVCSATSEVPGELAGEVPDKAAGDVASSPTKLLGCERVTRTMT
jgi:hypothetical protein